MVRKECEDWNPVRTSKKVRYEGKENHNLAFEEEGRGFFLSSVTPELTRLLITPLQVLQDTPEISLLYLSTYYLLRLSFPLSELAIVIVTSTSTTSCIFI